MVKRRTTQHKVMLLQVDKAQEKKTDDPTLNFTAWEIPGRAER